MKVKSHPWPHAGLETSLGYLLGLKSAWSTEDSTLKEGGVCEYIICVLINKSCLEIRR